MKIVLATGNINKVKELSGMLDPLGIQVVPQSEYAVPDVAETGTTFIENAIIKARHAAQITGLPAIADDSGLEVDALQGAPGIYSSRYSGEGATDSSNLQKLLVEMESFEPSERTARFHCVLAYMRHADDPTPIICHGVWEGSILRSAKGANGFGYDPVFWVESDKCSAAELTKERKRQLSHRGKALSLLLDKFRHEILGD